MNEHAVVALSITLLAGMGCQWIAWRLRLPAILFLLLCGILLGPMMNWLDPNRLFGSLLFPFISLAVAVILFEGSLTLKFKDIPGLEKVIRNLITLGVFVTWLITALAVRWLLFFSWEISFLFGALMVVTGPTVIVPMLRTVRPRENVAHILRWEGILTDPIGATLAILVYEFIVSGGTAGGFQSGAVVFLKIIAIGGFFGALGGYLFGIVLRRHMLPRYLHNFAALATVCAVFALSNTLEAESGLLSVTVMGICLANMKGLELEDILDFKESLSILLISMLFIILAARINLNAFIALGWPGLAVLGIIQFLARPLNAQLSALGSKLIPTERHLLAWIAPRGIVAAAISALFAIKLEGIGYQDASQLVPLTFMVIIGTVLLQSTTAGLIAKWLKVREPEPRGFLIIGANTLAQTIAKALQDNGFRVVVTDPNWDYIAEAKMNGLPAYWGNPASEHAERHLDLTGIGHLIAVSPNIELNALSAHYYRLEFEKKRIYAVDNHPPKNGNAEKKSAFKYGGRHLFREDMTYQTLNRYVTGGADIHTTLLTDEFSYEDYLQQHRNTRLPLFAIDDNENIHVFTPDPQFSPASGWKILALSIDAPIKAVD